MVPGDIVEIAIWMTGTETRQELDHWKKVVCRGVADQAAMENYVEVGPFSFEEKQPGEDRVPVVPDEISGPNVRLMVANAPVTAMPRPLITKETGFVLDLDKADLAKLRATTRRIHSLSHPGDRLSNKQCDQVIEYLGPEAAVQNLRGGATEH